MNHAKISRLLTGSLCAAMLILAGCEGARAPLGEPGEVPVDPALIGTWQSISDEEDMATLHVWAFNENEYYVEWETEDEEDDLARLRAYASDLGNFIFANIQCINCDADDRTEWFFFQYELESEDVLAIRSVNDSHYTEAMSGMTRSRDVRRYVEEHMLEEGFLEDNRARFGRVSDTE